MPKKNMKLQSEKEGLNERGKGNEKEIKEKVC